MKVPRISWLPKGHNHCLICDKVKNADENDNCQLLVMPMMPRLVGVVGLPRVSSSSMVMAAIPRYGRSSFFDQLRRLMMVSWINIRPGNIMAASYALKAIV